MNLTAIMHSNFNNGTLKSCPVGQGSGTFMLVLKVVYAVGIIGNGAAIICLRRGEKRVRNRKHLLLLTSLASNDLVALVGMMASMVAAELVPGVRETRAYCIIRVVLRVFGIGSVCIAVTMALERYLALTRPFLYQKGKHGANLLRHFQYKHKQEFERILENNKGKLPVSNKTDALDNKEILMKKLMNLVTIHGRPFTLLEDEAFLNIINLIPTVEKTSVNTHIIREQLQKRAYEQVTYYVIRTALLAGWGWAAALTCAPVAGLGLYYDEDSGCCTRYRHAQTTTDVAYAWVYVIFGTMLSVVLVYCNLAVIRALYEISAPRGAPVMRRVSKSSCRQRAPAGPHHNPATAEEVAFSRLMATLSVLFMICWLPQMVTSSLYLALGRAWWRRLAPLGNASDLLMLLNYVLDPLLYVLMRRTRPTCTCALTHALTACFKRNHKTSTESIKTSCCPQETLLVSDSSGAELKPLRALPAPRPHPLD